KLNAGYCALIRNKTGNPGQAVALVVIPQAEAVGRDPAPGLNVDSFGEDPAGTTCGPCAQVNVVPVVGQPVLAGLLAHG
ncbi:MAG TPA: hypothetical protein VLN90_09290, partial [Thioalkalivibrio sp.]|nr:hypothetical protein [Thioalkalivibrio sp.]